MQKIHQYILHFMRLILLVHGGLRLMHPTVLVSPPFLKGAGGDLSD